MVGNQSEYRSALVKHSSLVILLSVYKLALDISVVSRWPQTSNRILVVADKTELLPSARSIATRSLRFRSKQAVSSQLSKTL